jgi:hypothetical protein
MIFDIPEVLIMFLTALVVWIGARDWATRHRGRRR